MDPLNNNTAEEKEIDLLDLGRKLLLRKWFIIKASFIGLVIGVIIAFSIPKEYKTTVILTPEAKSSGGASSNMNALAAMAGINLSEATQDAISPELYPNIVGSTPFMLGLFNIKVFDKSSNVNTDLYSYIKDGQRSPWWSSILSLPSKILSSKSKVQSESAIPQISTNVVDLSRDQTKVIENLRSRINISVDKKTGTITLSSMMQSPEISAYIADTVTSYLQKYIIEYRTQKARQDLLFTQKMYDEARNQYYKSQKAYATYSDENLDIISARYRTTKERLQNEMNLAYSVYNQMAQQLQMAQMKVQDTTPVYTIIQPSVVPHIPEKPNKKLIVFSVLFVAFVISCSWVIGKGFFIDENK